MTHGVSLGAGYWLEMIERQRESQLSIDEFCRRRRISVHTFRSWKRRLAENATAPTFRELIVAESLGEDPLGGSLYLFRNRRGDRLKLLYWDGDGYALWYKRLERGTFQLPVAIGDSAVISSADLARLLDGVDLTTIRRRPRYRRPIVPAARNAVALSALQTFWFVSS